MRFITALVFFFPLMAFGQWHAVCGAGALVNDRWDHLRLENSATDIIEIESFKAVVHNPPADARNATELALEIWSEAIHSDIPIHLEITWSDQLTNVLAVGQPAKYFKNFTKPPLTHVWFPVALAEKLSNQSLNGAEDADIIIQISTNQPWYFGTDQLPPAEQFDLVSVLLHEIAHGLGFLSGATLSGEQVTIFNEGDLVPYDLLLTNDPSATPLYRSGASVDLTDLLTNQPVYLQTHCSEDFHEYKVFTSFPFLPSVSLSHLDTSFFENQKVLMAPYFQPGSAFHEIDAPTRQVLCALGWESKLSEQEVLVFPNPAQDQISIQVPSVLTHVHLKVYNSAGLLVTEAVNLKANNGQINLDLTFLTSGAYFISIENPVQGFQDHQRIILH